MTLRKPNDDMPKLYPGISKVGLGLIESTELH